MARTLNKLKAAQVEAMTTPGRHSDGGGLYLVVDALKPGAEGPPSKRWVFLYRWRGKLKEMGLGGVSKVRLATARIKAGEAREQLGLGLNPIAEKRANSGDKTFGALADELIATREGSWRNEKHAAAWKMTLNVHAAPIRNLPVDEISTEHLVDLLKPLTLRTPETASRLRGRIEVVLDAARAKGLIRPPWENPARWRGHLSLLLPPRKKFSRGHFAAMPYGELPAFMVDLREREAMSARALEFVILTAARTSEVTEAEWPEFDLEAKVWTVPAARMKGGREHRVPLTDRAIEILKAQDPATKFVFPGPGKDRSLSENAMLALLQKRMERPYTVHGFRSAFRDWGGEVSTFPREVIEAALAHTVGDETERAYRRGDALAKRRKLMEAWASYLQRVRSQTGNVTPIQRGAA